jgi:glutaconate CoA-transferase subunit B
MSAASADYSAAELMTIMASRRLRGGTSVFAGVGLPLLASVMARKTHTPRLMIVVEGGVFDPEMLPGRLPISTNEMRGAHRASMLLGITDTFLLAQRGYLDLGFIGGAQVDRFGNVNTSYIGEPTRPTIKLPGSGGACDIAALAGRTVIIMEHEPRRLVERVDYVTSPGHGDGAGWRAGMGLPGGGPSAIITTLAVLTFERETGEAVLASHHPGTDPAAVRAATGWALRSRADVRETPPPTADELAIIRRYDPGGFWTR